MRRALKAIALRIAFSETTTVSGLMIASASPTLENNRWRPTNINRSMLLKTGFLGVVRRRTMTCWRRTRFSASSAALDRNRPTSARQSSLQRSRIGSRIARFAVTRQRDKICGRDRCLSDAAFPCEEQIPRRCCQEFWGADHSGLFRGSQTINHSSPFTHSSQSCHGLSGSPKPVSKSFCTMRATLTRSPVSFSFRR